jgi:DNA modification methylase
MVNVELYNNDCLVVMHQLIENGIKVDAVIADIPYGIHNNKFDTMIPFNEMWDCLLKLLKDKGNIVLFASGLFTINSQESPRTLVVG